MGNDKSGKRPRMFLSLLYVGLLVLIVTGCASTEASVRPTGVVPTTADISGYRTLSLEVTKSDGVETLDIEVKRIEARIIKAIRTRQPDRFHEIQINRPADPAASVLHATVQLTRYDKGNAFARFMLAGLGQVHIDAKVTLKDHAKDAVLGEYDVNKTFAWGGIYGGSTRIEDVEAGFAEGVAAVILNARTQ